MPRAGSCTEGCGACCEVVTLNVNPAYLEKDNEGWLKLHGIRLVERGGGVWAYLPNPCRELQPDKSCGLFGKPERPKLCADWPFSPQELVSLKDATGADCTFYFEEP